MTHTAHTHTLLTHRLVTHQLESKANDKRQSALLLLHRWSTVPLSIRSLSPPLSLSLPSLLCPLASFVEPLLTRFSPMSAACALFLLLKARDDTRRPRRVHSDASHFLSHARALKHCIIPGAAWQMVGQMHIVARRRGEGGRGVHGGSRWAR